MKDVLVQAYESDIQTPIYSSLEKEPAVFLDWVLEDKVHLKE